MKTLTRTLAVLAVSAVLPACQTEDSLYPIGVTRGAGNAIAANTAMQMVDPWQEGVDETDLRVPSDRGDGEEDGATTAPPVSTQPTQ